MAQFDDLADASHSACLNAIPMDSMTRVAVFVTAVARNPDLSRVTPYLAPFAQEVAEQIDSLLGTPKDSLPRGEPTVTWKGLGAALMVTAWPDGRIESRFPKDSGDTSATALLARALSAARAGGAQLLWPPQAPKPLVFEITLRAPVVRHSGQLERLEDPIAIPVFTLAEPWKEAARVSTTRSAKYPSDAMSRKMGAKIFLDFVVDTNGLAEVRTIRDIWNADRPRFTGDSARYYDHFVEAARKVLPEWRFVPARVGGCVVSEEVDQQFNFKYP